MVVAVDRYTAEDAAALAELEYQPPPVEMDLKRDFIAIKDGGSDIACCGGDVPKDVLDKAMEARQGIIGGKLQISGGPLNDRDGKEHVTAGKVISDADWYVPGLITQKK